MKDKEGLPKSNHVRDKRLKKPGRVDQGIHYMVVCRVTKDQIKEAKWHARFDNISLAQYFRNAVTYYNIYKRTEVPSEEQLKEMRYFGKVAAKYDEINKLKEEAQPALPPHNLSPEGDVSGALKQST